MLPNEAIERFWNNVNKQGKQVPYVEGNCWEWIGTVKDTGYGCLRVSGKQLRAHRVSYLILNGHIPEGKKVLHKCDNPICVRPDHLFIGTQIENVADMVTKGRQGHGWNRTYPDKNYSNYKLTASAVKEIRERYSQGGVSQEKLAKEYGVNKAMIWRIIKRHRWKSI